MKREPRKAKQEAPALSKSLVTPPTTAIRRNISVDLFRILAASTIFYYHSGQVGRWPYSKLGEFAVATFVYLAAFCTVRYSHTTIQQTRPFWLARFKAIYPTFAVISILIFVVSFLYAPPKTGNHYTLGDLGANLLMISQYVGKPWMTAPMWFIPFVLQVYLILPFLARHRISTATVLLAFAVSGAACGLVYLLHRDAAGQNYDICRNWSPLFRLPEVIIGWVVGQTKTLRAAVRPIALYLAIALVLAIGADHLPLHDGQMLRLGWEGAFVFLVLAAIVGATRPLFRNVTDKTAHVIALLGRASFPFFLLHGPGIVFMGNVFGAHVVPWILYFVLTWSVAVLFTLGIDKLKLLQGLVAERSARPVGFQQGAGE
jgi:peptidoglycan/LPS O-acetylase OafA/YrhL